MRSHFVRAIVLEFNANLIKSKNELKCDPNIRVLIGVSIGAIIRDHTEHTIFGPSVAPNPQVIVSNCHFIQTVVSVLAWIMLKIILEAIFIINYRNVQFFLLSLDLLNSGCWPKPLKMNWPISLTLKPENISMKRVQRGYSKS